MHWRRWTIGLALSVAALTMTPAWGQEAGHESNIPIRIDFAGGTVGQYVELVQREFGGRANVVVEPDAKVVAIGPVVLTTFDPSDAASVVEHLEVDDEDQKLFVRKGPTYLVIGVQERAPDEPDRETHVWSLAPIVEGDTSLDDTISAIRFALEMTARSDLGGDRQLARVHEDTQLLMVHGSRAELEAVDQVISNLLSVSQWRESRAREKEESDALKQARAMIRDLEEEVRSLRAHTQQLELQMMHLQNERRE